MRNESHVIYNTSHTTTTSYSSVHLPKHFSLCEQMGWALRNHKPPRRIEKVVKDYIEKICQEEKTYGRKIPPEEYVAVSDQLAIRTDPKCFHHPST